MVNRKEAYLAIDIGASSGRHIVRIKGETEVDEVYRFHSYMDETEYGLVWNMDKLWHEVKTGIRAACMKYVNIKSLGIDTWGVDYVLFEGDEMKLPVFAYRNERTLDVINHLHSKIPFEKLYEITGIQYEPFNTIYQFYWDLLAGRIDSKTRFLMMPEFFFYKLTGKKVHEYTEATTTGMVNLKTKDYDKTIINKLGFPKSMFTKIVQPGFYATPLDSIKKELGFNGKVMLVATHDTAAALESVEIAKDSVYISSGTWSILGIKTKKAYNDEITRYLNFSNEGGFGYLMLQKNIMGLWIVQELKKELNYDSYEKIVETAKKSSYIKTFDVNQQKFLSPKSMKEVIKKDLERRYKIKGLSEADILNSVFHSLAKSYHLAIKDLEIITKKMYKSVTVFGGGANNQYLNQLIEEYTKRKVIAYPIEATAIGNINIQEKLGESKDEHH